MTQSIKKIIVLVLLLPIFLTSCSLSQKPVKQGKRHVKDFYIEDENGNRITSLKPNQKFFYLVVLSENIIGEKAILELDEEDKEVGYIYDGIYLTDKIELRIKSNKHRIKLYIYNPKSRYHRYLKEKALNSKNNKINWFNTSYLRLIDYFNL